MSDPRRLKEEFAGDLEGQLLRSVARDAPRGGARHRTLAALGFGGAALGLSGTTASAAAKTATLAVMAKWIGIGVGTAVLAIGVAYEAPRLGRVAGRPASAPVERGPAAPPVEGVNPTPAPAPVATPAPSADETNGPPAIKPSVAVGSAPRTARAAPRETEVAPTSGDATRSATEGPTASRDGVEKGLGGALDAPRLSREVAMLDAARRMSGTNPAAALRALDDYQNEFPRGDLAPEALVLRIEALVQLGQQKAAEKLAGDYLTRNPGSPHARKIRAILGGAGPSR